MVPNVVGSIFDNEIMKLAKQLIFLGKPVDGDDWCNFLIR